jgi:hypothetical protein
MEDEEDVIEIFQINTDKQQRKKKYEKWERIYK